MEQIWKLSLVLIRLPTLVRFAMFVRQNGLRIILSIALLCLVGSPAFAEQAAWRVGKMSGDVFISRAGVQKASLNSDASVQAGDGITTGRNGRVLLVRGDETILVAPNTTLAIPQSSRDGLSTTITQQSGSAAFNVEKRNVKH